MRKSAPGGVLTYVYCLVRATRRPSLRGAPDGLGGARSIRTLALGAGLWAIVTSVPASAYREAALARGLQDLDWVSRHAIAHESIVEHFLDAPAVLPMQLFTLFTSDERAIEHFVGDRPRIDAILTRIGRRLEWGLRLSFDETAVTGPARRSTASTGTGYLARKREQLDGARRRMAHARTEAERLFRAMAREASETRRHTATERAAPASRLLLDAAFLVPVRRSASFRASLRRNARALGARGIVVSLTGPWPPYNFITAPARRMARRKPLRKTR